MDARKRNSDLGVLVVGLGSFGSRRASAVRRSKGLRLAAVLDFDPALTLSQSRRLRTVAVGSLSEGLDRPDVNVVVVATPPADHDDVARLALKHGKHVLIEKPLAIDPDEARGLALLADSRGLRLATGFNHRFYTPVRMARALVDAGKIGRVESVRATIGHKANAEFLAGWHADRAMSGGGTLMDNGPHACDLVRLFLGEILAAQGHVRDTLGLPWGIESEAFALFRGYEKGVGEVRSSWALEDGYLTLEIRGDGGFLRVETAPWSVSGQLIDGSRVRRHFLAERAAEVIHRRRFGCDSSLVQELDAFAGDIADSMRPRQSA